MTQKSIVGVDAADGKLLWSHPHLTRGDQNVNAPLYHEGYVFTASGHSGGGRVVKINESSSAVEELWWDKDLDNCHGSVMQAGGYLYGSSCRRRPGVLLAELLTGRLAFREKRMEKLSLTAAEGLIYGLGQEGACTSFGRRRRSSKSSAVSRSPRIPRNLPGPTRLSPAAASTCAAAVPVRV